MWKPRARSITPVWVRRSDGWGWFGSRSSSNEHDSSPKMTQSANDCLPRPDASGLRAKISWIVSKEKRMPVVSAGGSLVDINPRRAKLSQTCHCGVVLKKSLSLRHHRCLCGVSAQRDLYSAFLAQFVDPKTSLLNAGRAACAWPSREPVLQAAFEQALANQPASGRIRPSSFGAASPRPSQSWSPAEGNQANAKSRDDVAVRKRTGRARKRQR